MAAKRSKGMTLDEHDALLKAQGLYENMRNVQQRREVERQKKIEQWREAEAPLVQALIASGLNVTSVWDLVNSPRPYPEAIPVLLDHLQRAYPERVREGIARALAVPEAITGWRFLFDLFRASDDQTTTGVKWALGCALAGAANDDVLGDVLTLIRDKRHGKNRIALLDVLLKSRSPRALEALADLERDDDVGPEISRARRESGGDAAPAK